MEGRQAGATLFAAASHCCCMCVFAMTLCSTYLPAHTACILSAFHVLPNPQPFSTPRVFLRVAWLDYFPVWHLSGNHVGEVQPLCNLSLCLLLCCLSPCRNLLCLSLKSISATLSPSSLIIACASVTMPSHSVAAHAPSDFISLLPP